MIQRGQKGEQRSISIKPQHLRHYLAFRLRSRLHRNLRRKAIPILLFIPCFSLFSGQQLFWRRIR